MAVLLEVGTQLLPFDLFHTKLEKRIQYISPLLVALEILIIHRIEILRHCNLLFLSYSIEHVINRVSIDQVIRSIIVE